jgi:hypothetical protein
MKKVRNVDSISNSNIAFSVKRRKINIDNIINKRIAVVCGLFSRLKKGPIIVNISPKVAEMKNLGNLSTLSQKSDIIMNLIVFSSYYFVLN